MMHSTEPITWNEPCLTEAIKPKHKQRLLNEQFYSPLCATHVSEMLIVIIAEQKLACKHAVKPFVCV